MLLAYRMCPNDTALSYNTTVWGCDPRSTPFFVSVQIDLVFGYACLVKLRQT